MASALRYAFTVGDVLTHHDIERLERVAPGITNVNLYGTTETQRAVSSHITTSSKVSGKQRIPLGRGMPGVQLLVLNHNRELAGIGELGQIHVRSPHLARGYVSDDGLTRERFILNPYTGEANDRVYVTGDLGRYLPDGNTEFVGRVDQQIKIRGFRIEPGEIEVALARHTGIRAAVVMARALRPGDKGAKVDGGDAEPGVPKPAHLIAYVVCRDGVTPAADDLRQHLRKRVPDYMIPAAFVFLDELPLTPNEKVDRDALPEPTEPIGERDYMAPRSAMEEVVAQIWSDVLRLERVGIHDNFFELGGHSLLATQAVQRMRDALKVELPLRSLFESATIGELADLIDTMRWAVQEPDDSLTESTDEEAF